MHERDAEQHTGAEELLLARRELKFVRDEQVRLAEELQRVRRQRTQLKRQAEVLARGLAAELSEAYWSDTKRGLARRLARLGRPGSASAEEQAMVREVEASPLFDGAWYLRHNLDVAHERVSPAAHYVRQGGAAGRDPSELFNTRRYLQRNPAVRDSGLPPLVHHVRVHGDDASAGH